MTRPDFIQAYLSPRKSSQVTSERRPALSTASLTRTFRSAFASVLFWHRTGLLRVAGLKLCRFWNPVPARGLGILRRDTPLFMETALFKSLYLKYVSTTRKGGDVHLSERIHLKMTREDVADSVYL